MFLRCLLTPEITVKSVVFIHPMSYTLFLEWNHNFQKALKNDRIYCNKERMTCCCEPDSKLPSCSTLLRYLDRNAIQMQYIVQTNYWVTH